MNSYNISILNLAENSFFNDFKCPITIHHNSVPRSVATCFRHPIFVSHSALKLHILKYIMIQKGGAGEWVS